MCAWNGGLAVAVFEEDSVLRSAVDRKAMGAYFTNRMVASFLARWAIRSPDDVVLEPSFGQGAFLDAAVRRLDQIGALPNNLYGVELNPESHGYVLHTLARDYGIPQEQLLLQDFFEVNPAEYPADVVIGNPPFIRHHRFTGESRKRAIKRAKEANVHLVASSSCWAPFVIHAVNCLKEKGRIAMVVPAELTYAVYAKPVLRFLKERFERVALLTFGKRLFAELSEDTLLLLADGYRRAHRRSTLIGRDPRRGFA